MPAGNPFYLNHMYLRLELQPRLSPQLRHLKQAPLRTATWPHLGQVGASCWKWATLWLKGSNGPRGGRVLGDGRRRWPFAVALVLAVRKPRPRAWQKVGVVGNRQVRHRAVYFFFDLLVQAGHVQFGLGARRRPPASG